MLCVVYYHARMRVIGHCRLICAASARSACSRFVWVASRCSQLWSFAKKLDRLHLVDDNNNPHGRIQAWTTLCEHAPRFAHPGSIGKKKPTTNAKRPEKTQKYQNRGKNKRLLVHDMSISACRVALCAQSQTDPHEHPHQHKLKKKNSELRIHDCQY